MYIAKVELIVEIKEPMILIVAIVPDALSQHVELGVENDKAQQFHAIQMCNVFGIHLIVLLLGETIIQGTQPNDTQIVRLVLRQIMWYLILGQMSHTGIEFKDIGSVGYPIRSIGKIGGRIFVRQEW